MKTRSIATPQNGRRSSSGKQLKPRLSEELITEICDSVIANATGNVNVNSTANMSIAVRSQNPEAPEDYYLTKYTGLRHQEQVKGLVMDLAQQYKQVEELQVCLLTAQQAQSSLAISNLQLSKQANDNRKLAETERQRAEEAWRQLDAVKIYSQASNVSTEQRHFQDRKVGKAMQDMKDQCDKRVNKVIKERGLMDTQIKRLQTMLKTRKQEVNVLKGCVKALIKIFGKASNVSEDTARRVFLDTVKFLGNGHRNAATNINVAKLFTESSTEDGDSGAEWPNSDEVMMGFLARMKGTGGDG